MRPLPSSPEGSGRGRRRVPRARLASAGRTRAPPVRRPVHRTPSPIPLSTGTSRPAEATPRVCWNFPVTSEKRHEKARGRLAGLATAAIGASILLTITIGLLGPSPMVPALTGPSWQPPYSLDVHPNPYLVIALAAAAIILGGLGLLTALALTRPPKHPHPPTATPQAPPPTSSADTPSPQPDETRSDAQGGDRAPTDVPRPGALGADAQRPGLPGADATRAATTETDTGAARADAAQADAARADGSARPPKTNGSPTAAPSSRRRPLPSARLLVLIGCAAAAILAFLPPSGSGDHLNYAAYGRMVTLGLSPYTHGAVDLPGDPIADAVEDPWREEPSVYGPVATAVQAVASWIGGDSLRLTIFVLALFNAAAFIVTALLIDRFTRDDPARRLRAALLWTANPLLLYQLVAGMHVDTLAIACMVAALLARSRPTGSGVLLGLGVAIKVNSGLVALGPAWELRRRPARLALMAACALAVVVIGYAIVGPEAIAPMTRTSKSISHASFWKLVQGWLQSIVGTGSAYRGEIQIGSILVLALIAWALLRLASRSRRPASPPANEATPIPPNGPGHPTTAATSPAPSSSVSDRATSQSTNDPERGTTNDSGSETSNGVGRGTDNDLASGTSSGAGRWASRWTASHGNGGLEAPVVAAGLVVAYLFATPYILPWYDGLALGLLALVAASAVDGFVVAHLLVLSLAYLPARVNGQPEDLEWLRTVVRPQLAWVLLALTVALVVWAWRTARRERLLSTPARHGELQGER
ncbi:polyprenol phosphomannose-dependent alpha 1,6 mannosyltransferase MptB [Nonomuraea sp. NPDC005650]|uniref:polyprenol phosphomannose-dependent alpha 1,6 mannosyltransferase MptB n=1 Tax=Nonomuraea sp. NPDC005650 TaxID=3157045 RepID=UPI0033B67497